MCLTKSNEIESSLLDHHSKHTCTNETMQAKGDELQFEINNYNRRKLDGMHGIEQIENPIVRFQVRDEVHL